MKEDRSVRRRRRVLLVLRHRRRRTLHRSHLLDRHRRTVAVPTVTPVITNIAVAPTSGESCEQAPGNGRELLLYRHCLRVQWRGVGRLRPKQGVPQRR